MDNTINEKIVNQLIRSIYQYSDNKEELFLEICKQMFIRRHGSHYLEQQGIDLDHSLRTYQLAKELAGTYENIDIVDFAELYDGCMGANIREKTGSFYTPYYIIDYMIDRVLSLYLQQNTDVSRVQINGLVSDAKAIDIDSSRKLFDCLRQMTIIDIACGTGLFLVRFSNKLFQLMKKLNHTLHIMTNDVSIMKDILNHNIYGLDIQEIPVQITQMALLSNALQYPMIQNDHDDRIRPNVLQEDSLLAEDFFQKGAKKFDIVIGNPPYIGEKGNKELFHRIKYTAFGRKHYEGKMDYFYFFIYKGMEILKEKGLLSFITTNYFVTADGAAKLREYLKQKCCFQEIVNFNEYEIFKSAKGQHNMIFFLTKGIREEEPICIKNIKEKNLKLDEIKSLLINNEDNDKASCYEIRNQQQLYTNDGKIALNVDYKDADILEKIARNKDTVLGKICKINQGMVSGADKVTESMLDKKLDKEIIEEYELASNQGIFVLNQEEIEKLRIADSPYLRPMYKNSDIERYRTRDKTEKFVLYITDKNMENPSKDDPVIQYLSRFKNVLNQRRETQKGLRNWFALQWPRQQEIFEGEKIVVPHRALENKFAYNCLPWYGSADIYYITPLEADVELKTILCQLNAKLMYYWLFHRGKRKGNYLELYASPLKELPIILDIDAETLQVMKRHTEEMIRLGEKENLYEEINQIIYQRYDLTKEEICIIEKFYDKMLKRR
ncbi:MAG: Eco57I restriction-modification methylase domain-containing protein [Bacillota bacterium]